MGREVRRVPLDFEWPIGTEGSPKSPVFPTAEDLVAWMSDPDRGNQWVPPEHAATFVKAGWAPSFVSTAQTGVVSGVEWIGSSADAQ